MRPLIFSFLTWMGSLATAQPPSIIPQPVSVQQQPGSFLLSKNTVIVVKDEEDKKTARFLNDYLQQVYGFSLDVDKEESKNYIRIVTRKFIRAPEKDGYTLTVTKNGVTIEGDSYAGSFYGMQTMIQLLPTEKSSTLQLPLVSIQDYPRFNYRGMHLDVCRHLFSLSFIKKYIDYLALHKMNYFHWHLTDDQGWRIEIKKHSSLTTTGAWRNGTIIGRYPGIGNDNKRYGGFYTQEDVKEIVRYAADRHITVIPEIEMPGHSSAAIAAYPWLSCFPHQPTVIPSHPSEKSKELQARGVKKLVQETWGVFEDIFCAGNDSTFMFLQEVMDEVLELFPSKYIHVGGDEAPKNHWKKCERCQARIRAEGLKDEHELQRYFIQRMEKYLNSKGRILIGWDEILEGGLAPNAVVMSWRGEKGGIEAARQNHFVIMTPGNPVYFDHSQTRNEDSLVIGGYNPIEAVYAYEPIPKELDSSKAKFVLGAQANLWTEYITNPAKVEYMIFPRMSALSEVLWSPASGRNWKTFEKKLPVQFRRYDLWKANYSKAFYDVEVSLTPTPTRKGILVKAKTRDNLGKLFYVFNGLRKAYKAPFTLNSSGDLSIFYYRNNQQVNRQKYHLEFNKATGKTVTLAAKPNDRYPGQVGAFSLVNGIYSNKGLSHPDWLGFIGDDIEAVIDLGSISRISKLRMHTIDQNGSWVYLPRYVEVLVSTDGKNFVPAGRSSQFEKDTLTMGWITVQFPPRSARFVKLVAKNFGEIPEGMPGAGNKAWIFADEVQIN